HRNARVRCGSVARQCAVRPLNASPPPPAPRQKRKAEPSLAPPATPSAHVLCPAHPALTGSSRASSSALAVLAVLGLVLELFTAPLDVLARAGHGVAGGQGGNREQAQQGQGNDALHKGLPSGVMPARHVRLGRHFSRITVVPA